VAALIVTPAALTCIREHVHREEISRPLVSVSWAIGAADLRRGPKGEAFWEREPDGWIATVLDLAELEDAGIAPLVANCEAHGFGFLLSGRPESPLLEGCRLDAIEGKLVVYEDAT
jgi:hypothetical protein